MTGGHSTGGGAFYPPTPVLYRIAHLAIASSILLTFVISMRWCLRRSHYTICSKKGAFRVAWVVNLPSQLHDLRMRGRVYCQVDSIVYIILFAQQLNSKCLANFRTNVLIHVHNSVVEVRTYYSANISSRKDFMHNYGF